MSRPLKQSSVAFGAFGLYLPHEFMCYSRGNTYTHTHTCTERERALNLFKDTATSKTQVVDEELLTEADLNISEDEAYPPGRREGSSGDNMWKTSGVQTKGSDMYSIN